MIHFKRTFIACLGFLTLAVLLYPGVKSLQVLMEEEYIIKEKGLLLNGEYIESLTNLFENNISLQKGALSFWSGLKYHLFREGNQGVLIGEENWLFTSEEFDEELEPAVSYIDFFREVERIKAFFDNVGLTLIIVPIPSKSRVYKEKIRRFPYSSTLENRYEDALFRFREMGIPYIDLKKVFHERAPEELYYYQFDTHWTERGASRAAREVAAVLDSRNVILSFPKRSFYIAEKERKTFRGDLLAYVPPLKDKEETYNQKVLIDADPPSLGLFDDPVIPILLVGTSYSFDSRWNFETELKLALQLDVLNLAKEGVGPMEPMKELMESEYYRETGSAVVIWEIPERYIPLRQ